MISVLRVASSADGQRRHGHGVGKLASVISTASRGGESSKRGDIMFHRLDVVPSSARGCVGRWRAKHNQAPRGQIESIPITPGVIEHDGAVDGARRGGNRSPKCGVCQATRFSAGREI